MLKGSGLNNNNNMIIVKVIGGLGNQLFQYATGKALALKFNSDLKLDVSFYDDPKYSGSLRLTKFDFPIELAEEYECNGLKNKRGNKFIRLLKHLGIKFPPFYQETHLVESDVMHLFNKESSSLDSKYYIEGWFANENYFKNYRDELLKDFDMDSKLTEPNKALMNEIKRINSVAVHIRRGDYLTNNYFTNLPTEYYFKAINYFCEHIDNPKFYFFSDDIQWVKKEFVTIVGAIFVDSNANLDSANSTSDDISDLMLMRSCKHNIMANSTFSWWGAWLNNNPEKKVVVPKIWFNNLSAQANYENGNFIPAKWIKF
jgi:hypothetical protein